MQDHECHSQNCGHKGGSEAAGGVVISQKIVCLPIWRIYIMCKCVEPQTSISKNVNVKSWPIWVLSHHNYSTISLGSGIPCVQVFETMLPCPYFRCCTKHGGVVSCKHDCFAPHQQTIGVLREKQLNLTVFGWFRPIQELAIWIPPVGSVDYQEVAFLIHHVSSQVGYSFPANLPKNSNRGIRVTIILPSLMELDQLFNHPKLSHSAFSPCLLVFLGALHVCVLVWRNPSNDSARNGVPRWAEVKAAPAREHYFWLTWLVASRNTSGIQVRSQQIVPSLLKSLLGRMQPLTKTLFRVWDLCQRKLM